MQEDINSTWLYSQTTQKTKKKGLQSGIKKKSCSETKKQSKRKKTTVQATKPSKDVLKVQTLEIGQNDNNKDEPKNVEYENVLNVIKNFDCIHLLALRNAKNKFLIPSKENYFEGFRIDVVMIDSGCNSLLCPIVDEEAFYNLVQHFPTRKYRWRIGKSKGVQARSLVLVIKRKKSSINMKLEIETNLVSRTLEVRKLRFHLSAEDVKNPLLHQNLSTLDLTILQNCAKDYDIPRRQHALLGQAILNGLCSIQYENLFMVVDASKFPGFPEELVKSIQENVQQATKESKPKNWNDVHDEDHDE